MYGGRHLNVCVLKAYKYRVLHYGYGKPPGPGLGAGPGASIIAQMRSFACDNHRIRCMARVVERTQRCKNVDYRTEVNIIVVQAVLWHKCK